MKNNYLNSDVAFDRLYAEYQKHKKIIIAVDHDDTVYDFHKRGHDHSDVIGLIQECHRLGFYIVVYTASRQERWKTILDYWKDELNIIPSAINQNPFPLPYGNCGKIYYNILLDDRAGLASAYETLRRLVDDINLKETD